MKNWFLEDGYEHNQILEKHNWILTIHFSFEIDAYVEDENVKIIEDDILKAISFNGGISGTTAVLVDAEALFGKIAL